MKQLIFAAAALPLLLLAASVSCRAQPDDDMAWPDSLNTAKDVDYLTEDEKGVIYEMNKVRTNPKLYAEYIKRERSFYSNKRIEKPGQIPILTQEGVAAVDECIAALQKALPTGVIRPNRNLGKAAQLLAKYQSKTGKTGHTGSNGSTVSDRIKRYCTEMNDNFGYGYGITFGENISYGSSKPQDIVVQLLIDDGVPSRGHRVNILKPDFNTAGVAIDTHPRYRHLCVIDYAFLVYKP
ncbi:MAG: CAP domain-containing protein [Prevotellaceae bacterium]|nr:CAP domain-containing protein [Prevotellaceae bacterium]